MRLMHHAPTHLTSLRIAARFSVVAFLFGGGCMPGMTVKMPMPDSMTIGTMKNEDRSTVATGMPKNGRPLLAAGTIEARN